MSNAIVLVLTTFEHLNDAQSFTTALLDQQLASCISIHSSVSSHYTWNQKRCSTTEIPVTIKTIANQLPALSVFFDTHHPYECPEYVVISGQGSETYANWVRNQVKS